MNNAGGGWRVAGDGKRDELNSPATNHPSPATHVLWITDVGGLGHPVRSIGPSCAVTYCGLALRGETYATTPACQCGECHRQEARELRELERRARPEQSQGRLF